MQPTTANGTQCISDIKVTQYSPISRQNTTALIPRGTNGENSNGNSPFKEDCPGETNQKAVCCMLRERTEAQDVSTSHAGTHDHACEPALTHRSRTKKVERPRTCSSNHAVCENRMSTEIPENKGGEKGQPHVRKDLEQTRESHALGEHWLATKWKGVRGGMEGQTSSWGG